MSSASRNYEDWLNIGMALKSAFVNDDAEGYRLWEQFSQDYPGNTVKVIKAKWCSFHPHSITVATLFHLADGIDPDWRKPFMNGFADSEFVEIQWQDYLTHQQQDQKKSEEEPDPADEPPPDEPDEAEPLRLCEPEGLVAVGPEPMDIFGALTHEPVLTPDMLPDKIRDFVYDQSELLGCDAGAMALTALAVCSSLISDEITVQPRRFDTTYRESARLWLMLIGRSSNCRPAAARARAAAAIAAKWNIRG